ncbi:hypothetical protein F5883DRAFT_647047 [Diaporthe sp. PMI_573]|nr:hypothetical protein F5883DRAFT_647047 [Diaporthaceae sp. PMI_573]
MDRLGSGFQSKNRTASPSRPTLITDGTQRAEKTTPEPLLARGPLHVQPPPSKVKKTSPLLSLRDLNCSHKRKWSPTTGSFPHSPIGATYTCDRLDDTPTTSPTVRGCSRDSHPQLQDILQHTDGHSTGGQPPKMPSFLALSPQKIVAKFHRIVRLERNRILQSLTNPSPNFKWARVTGDHLKDLDRYMNIQPWENNRVKLHVPSGKVDYINASPITPSSTKSLRKAQGQSDKDTATVGLSDPAGIEPDRYIAMQGPKRNTTDHVWLPSLFPGDTALEINERDEFGDAFRASVHCEAVEETEAGDAIKLRKLIIRLYKNPSKVTKACSDGDRDNNEASDTGTD